jgi:hypothetical protein
MMLLKTMLREAGLRAELWVARDNFGADLKPGGNPLFETYDSPYLAVWTGEGKPPVMVITGSKVCRSATWCPGMSGARRCACRSARTTRPARDPAARRDRPSWPRRPQLQA